MRNIKSHLPTRIALAAAALATSSCAIVPAELGLHDSNVHLTAKGLAPALQVSVRYKGACKISVENAQPGAVTQIVTDCIGDSRYDQAVLEQAMRVVDPVSPTFTTSVWAKGWDQHLVNGYVLARRTVTTRPAVGQGAVPVIKAEPIPANANIAADTVDRALGGVSALQPIPAPVFSPSSSADSPLRDLPISRDFGTATQLVGEWRSLSIQDRAHKFVALAMSGALPAGFERRQVLDERRYTTIWNGKAVRALSRVTAPGLDMAAVEFELIALQPQPVDPRQFLSGMFSAAPLDADVYPRDLNGSVRRARLVVVEARGSRDLAASGALVGVFGG